MKLEKFDYQIGNGKQKKQFVTLGALCIALIITVVLYKTFASFSNSASYNIINSRVGNLANNRTAVISVDISNPNSVDNHVNAVLYDDNTLSIEGTGYMMDFNGVDLIGKVLDAYIADKADTIFTSEQRDFIAAHQKMMNSLFDYYARSFLSRDASALTAKINDSFDAADLEVVNAILTIVSGAGFDIDQIEIADGVLNIGENAFSLINATTTSDARESIYTDLSNTVDYGCAANTAQAFNLVTINGDIETVGANAMKDLLAENISIGSTVTTIPDDLFSWYNGGIAVVCTDNNGIKYSQQTVNNNATLSIPDSVTKIGYGAFYSYNGASLTLPANLEELGQFAFANYFGNDFSIPSTATSLANDAFRDFTGKITMNSCPGNYQFAPNADVYDINNTWCNQQVEP